MPSSRPALAWLLPPALAVAGIALQFAMDVPHHAMLQHEARAPAKRGTTATRTPRKSSKPVKPYKARSKHYVERLRKSWADRPIADEPRDRRFAEHHEGLLRAVVRKSEAAAVAVDDMGLLSTKVDCHSIRCELELCSPTKSAEQIVAQLPKFSIGGRSLWHDLREVESEQPSNATRTCHRFMVDFAVEGADPRKLRLGP